MATLDATENCSKPAPPVLSERIVDARKRAGLNQTELALRIGVRSQSVNNWESGTKNPGRKNLVKLASLFGVPVDWLLYERALSTQVTNDMLISSGAEGRFVPQTSIEEAVARRPAKQGARLTYAHFPCSESTYWFEMPNDSMGEIYPRGSIMYWDPTISAQPGDVVLCLSGADGLPAIGELSYETGCKGKLTIVTPANRKWPAARSDLDRLEVVATLCEASIRPR